ncbi:uncharacterized protein M6B38_106855 [Iris pallida]|uniref:Uncharacterized protein n=1 Tax=Iris pallida TaxID=29817 RepID=A0AAX6ES83_IRIPA|nr:uncharacterized protein M6B38_106855 [Iris pallida]
MLPATLSSTTDQRSGSDVDLVYGGVATIGSPPWIWTTHVAPPAAAGAQPALASKRVCPPARRSGTPLSDRSQPPAPSSVGRPFFSSSSPPISFRVRREEESSV